MSKNKYFLLGLILIFAQCCYTLAGLEWQMKIVSKKGEKVATSMIHLYAQNGNVREEFSEGSIYPLAKEGSYFLYKSEGNLIYLVNPKDKTYTEMPLEQMLQALGAMQMMTIQLTNVKVNATKLPSEKIGNYSCNHIMLDTSYDMNLKIMFMSVKQHIEQSHEIWGTKEIPIDELAATFKEKSFKLGMKDVDELIEKYKNILEDVGFIVKSVIDHKITDLKNNKTEHTITETTAYNIESKKLSNDLFIIPANYKKQELFPSNFPMGEKK